MSTSYVSKQLGLLAMRQTLWVVIFVGSMILQFVDGSGAYAKMDKADDFGDFDEFDSEEFENIPVASKQSGSKDAPAEKPPDPSIKVQQEKVKAEEFEQADVDDDREKDEGNGVVEEEAETPDEFAHFQDSDEFENFQPDAPSVKKSDGHKSKEEPTLKFTHVPMGLRNDWINFQVEIMMVFGIAVYVCNYLYGKAKNQGLATAWYEAHKEILEQNFSVVGDDGRDKEQPSHDVLIKESDHHFNLWCTGRAGCNGMLVSMKLLKRQDLVNMMSRIVKPAYDQVIIKCFVTAEDMDTFVFACGKKKSITKLGSELNDLASFCTERKSGDADIPESMTILSEIGEATQTMLDYRVTATLKKYDEAFEYMHFTDQYTGLKATEGESTTKRPDAEKLLVFCFNIPGKNMANERHIQTMRPLLSLVFYLLDKVRRFRLTKEAKAKAEKNRAKVQSEFMKSTHAQRQELAQQRKEEKIRERKEKMMNEEDPEKQKRLEKLELKRELKKKQPKMKQLKVKAM